MPMDMVGAEELGRVRGGLGKNLVGGLLHCMKNR